MRLFGYKRAALDYFNDPLLFSYSNRISHVESWVSDHRVKSTEFIYKFVGSIRGQLIAFSEENIKAFDIRRDEITQDPKRLSSFAYALLYVGELAAKRFIFCEVALCPILDLLGQWDYFSVANPGKGDLVLYLTSDRVPKHMAVFVEEQWVHSKFGESSPYSYTHKMFDLFSDYGTRVIFFRKGPGLS